LASVALNSVGEMLPEFVFGRLDESLEEIEKQGAVARFALYDDRFHIDHAAEYNEALSRA
jgi:hypothetical protein